MSELFLKIVNMSISASWLVFAVLFLRLTLKKAPKWVNVLLWGFVAFRLICPFSVESVLSLIPSAETISSDIMMDRTPSVTTGIPALNNVINPVIAHSFTPNPIASVNPLQIWIPISALIWIAGMVLMALYTAISYWRLRRTVATAVLLRENIFQSETVRSPFVLGILKPRIYLPYTMNEPELTHVIAHEKTHIRRADHWWKPLGFLLLTVHWFNPMMWLAYILLCRDIELACDEKVIQKLGREERADYTEALLVCSINRRMIAACPLAFGEVGVKERVKNVMNYKKPTFWIVLMAVIICVAVAVCFLTNPPTPSLEALPLVHSHSYAMVEVSYESPTLGLGEMVDPRFRVTENMELGTKSENVSYTGWIDLGTLTEMTLSKDNFDRLFYNGEGWIKGESAAKIRKNAAHAWELVREDLERFYYLIQLRNGELFLAAGYYDTAEKNDPGSDDTAISVLYRIAVDLNEEYNIIARSGDHTVPLTVFPAGTAVGNYAKAVHYLTIDPGEDFAPFRIYQNGEEIIAHYFAYDAQTYEQLPYLVPSGLDPQTYLFQNADPDREYIVGAVLEAEQNADVYCFGVRFANPVNAVLQAKVMEIRDGFFLVQPVPGSWELNSADLIEVPMEHMDPSPEPEVGDILRIEYDGYLQETYPARIAKVHHISVAEAFVRMINVSGIIYIDTGEVIPAEIDPSAILGECHTQVDGRPRNHAQGNFDCVGCKFARVERDIAVLIDQEWYRFTEEILTSPEYYLTIGDAGVYQIAVNAGSQSGVMYREDWTPYEKGEQVLLEGLTGKEHLSGVTIKAMDADGNDIFSVTISTREHGATDGVIECGEWVITPKP